jgi:co-chaperonin GroES (HSP10)
MIIEPLFNQILIKPVQNEAIIGASKFCEYGEVVGIGKDVKEVAVGDKIGFIKWGVNELVIGEEKFIFIQEESRWILGKIK